MDTSALKPINRTEMICNINPSRYFENEKGEHYVRINGTFLPPGGVYAVNLDDGNIVKFDAETLVTIRNVKLIDADK